MVDLGAAFLLKTNLTNDPLMKEEILAGDCLFAFRADNGDRIVWSGAIYCGHS
jgi:hypothetical protein